MARMRGFDALLGAGADSFVPWLSMFTGGGGGSAADKERAATEARERARREEEAARSRGILFGILGATGVAALGATVYFLVRKR